MANTFGESAKADVSISNEMSQFEDQKIEDGFEIEEISFRRPTEETCPDGETADELSIKQSILDEVQQTEETFYMPGVQDHHPVCRMPANTWGSTILSTLIYKGWLSGHHIDPELVVVGGLQLFGLVCSVGTQVVLIHFLGHLAEERHPEQDCNRTDFLATFTCTLLLMGQIMISEIRETVSMLKFINQIPWRKEEDNREDGIWLVMVRMTDEANNIGEPVTGIGLFHSIVLYILLLLKLFMAVWLGVNAYDFIMYTNTDHDILLNCTAMIFIGDVDDICFRLFNPTSLQRMYEDYPFFIDPPLDIKMKHICDWFRWCCKRDGDKPNTYQQGKHAGKFKRGLSYERKILFGTWAVFRQTNLWWFQPALYGAYSFVFTVYSCVILNQFYCGPDFVHHTVNARSFNERAGLAATIFLGGLILLPTALALVIVLVAEIFARFAKNFPWFCPLPCCPSCCCFKRKREKERASTLATQNPTEHHDEPQMSSRLANLQPNVAPAKDGAGISPPLSECSCN